MHVHASNPDLAIVMFRIVEDDMPHLPEGCSEPLEDFLRQCFNKDPSKRPTAEDLCEHEWLKVTWGAGRDPYEQDSIPFLRQISTDVKQSWPSIAQHLAQSDNPPRSETSDSDDGPKPKPKLTPTLNKRNSNARSAGWPPFSDTSNMGSSLPTKDSVPSPWMISDVHQTLSGVTSPSPNPDPPFTFKGVSPFKRSSSSWSLPEPIVALSTPSTKDEIFVRTRRRTRASSLGSARPGDAAELLEPKTQEQLSFLNLRDESWDDEPSIMVHPDLQLVRFISVYLLPLGHSTIV
jgi:serine/threonine protein kinase